MKKGLALLLVILIITNFHCARFRVGTTGSEAVLASCSATLMDFSGDTVELKKGRIFLRGKSLLFKTEGEVKEIPYSHISSVDVLENNLSGLSRVPKPDFTTGGDKKPNRGAILALGMLFLIMALAFLFYFIVPLAGIDMNIYFDSDGGRETAAFQLTQGELVKIYPLLLEKIG